jgi:GntR family transcriptional regulator
LQLDQLISAFLKMARENGFTLAEIRSRVKGWLDFQPPDHFLIIEPEPELRRILLAEIREATGFPVQGAGLDSCRKQAELAGAALVAMYGRADELKEALPFDASCLMLRTRSAAELEKLQINASSEPQVAIVSRWPDFLRWARAVLLARGIEAAQLSFRDAREKHWQKGLRFSVVITDVVTADQLPPGCRPLILNLIAESSLQELRQFVDQFLGGTRGVSSKNRPSRAVSST